MVNVLAVLLSFYVWLFCRYHLENFNFMSLNIIGVISMVNLMFSDCLLICLFCNVQISEKIEVILRKKHWSFLKCLELLIYLSSPLGPLGNDIYSFVLPTQGSTSQVVKRSTLKADVIAYCSLLPHILIALCYGRSLRGHFCNVN